jgi:hypothetical protein
MELLTLLEFLHHSVFVASRSHHWCHCYRAWPQCSYQQMLVLVLGRYELEQAPWKQQELRY